MNIEKHPERDIMDAVDADPTAAQTVLNIITLQFTDALIAEVERRPILWDKTFKVTRIKLTEEWQCVASVFNKTIEEVKSKWRNLKDTFRREEKKIILPDVDEGKPVLSYYRGQWDKFEKLLFLYNKRRHTRTNNEEYFVQSSESDIIIKDVKQEYDPSEEMEQSDDYNSLAAEELSIFSDVKQEIDVKDEEIVKLPTMSPNIEPNPGTDHNIPNETNRKRALNDSSDIIASKKPATEQSTVVADVGENIPVTSVTDHNFTYTINTNRALDDSKDKFASKRPATEYPPIETDIDEEMLVKSLVPFLRKLNPVRKLVVRNELQCLLLKEMLCDRCRTRGLQRDCHCNFK